MEQENKGFGIELTSELMDSLAWFARVICFKNKFKNYVVNYFVKIKKYEVLYALAITGDMYMTYFKTNNHNIIGLWQNYINNEDIKDCIISLMNQEFDNNVFDIEYFDGNGKYIGPKI